MTVAVDDPTKGRRERLLEPLHTASSKLKLKPRAEVAKLALSGEVSPEEAGAFLLAREIRKLPEKREVYR